MMASGNNTIPVVCLVTGGSRGIGRAICIELAARGCSVAFTFHYNDDAAESTMNHIKAVAPTPDLQVFVSLRCDVKKSSECQHAVTETVRMCGRLDVLVNNAGICRRHDVVDDSDFASWREAMRDVMETNFYGAAELSQLATQQFIAQRGEKSESSNSTVSSSATHSLAHRMRIVNITSRAAYRGELDAPGYAASKAALGIFGQSMARRLGPLGIPVYTVAPGWVETEMAKEALSGPNAAEVLAQHPLGRVAQPEEVAKEVVYLCLDAPLAMTGCVVDVNGASYLR